MLPEYESPALSIIMLVEPQIFPFLCLKGWTREVPPVTSMFPPSSLSGFPVCLQSLEFS